ncbi:hypothetical protein CALCODRAFT_506682 [Calocera cornea HHB12733]|uniref:Uncharacterized protein n=1 Tax=Calocera cornea HHB12733 TaxID=1353952 RepID=A0A165IPD1_9BASI|nr:hypothetical protein CALCODRAFT_506682 [Calocera cornea HHB12733]
MDSPPEYSTGDSLKHASTGSLPRQKLFTPPPAYNDNDPQEVTIADAIRMCRGARVAALEKLIDRYLKRQAQSNRQSSRVKVTSIMINHSNAGASFIRYRIDWRTGSRATALWLPVILRPTGSPRSHDRNSSTGARGRKRWGSEYVHQFLSSARSIRQGERKSFQSPVSSPTCSGIQLLSTVFWPQPGVLTIPAGLLAVESDVQLLPGARPPTLLSTLGSRSNRHNNGHINPTFPTPPASPTPGPTELIPVFFANVAREHGRRFSSPWRQSAYKPHSGLRDELVKLGLFHNEVGRALGVVRFGLKSSALTSAWREGHFGWSHQPAVTVECGKKNERGVEGITSAQRPTRPHIEEAPPRGPTPRNMGLAAHPVKLPSHTVTDKCIEIGDNAFGDGVHYVKEMNGSCGAKWTGDQNRQLNEVETGSDGGSIGESEWSLRTRSTRRAISGRKNSPEEDTLYCSCKRKVPEHIAACRIQRSITIYPHGMATFHACLVSSYDVSAAPQARRQIYHWVAQHITVEVHRGVSHQSPMTELGQILPEASRKADYDATAQELVPG